MSKTIYIVERTSKRFGVEYLRYFDAGFMSADRKQGRFEVGFYEFSDFAESAQRMDFQSAQWAMTLMSQRKDQSYAEFRVLRYRDAPKA